MRLVFDKDPGTCKPLDFNDADQRLELLANIGVIQQSTTVQVTNIGPSGAIPVKVNIIR
ncbi:MAG TPA: hypothetical protein VI913_02890 [Candidatus Peribacteraceae bacterium]|nr:hypothetical protein [Candidatus Peribacteraceae bacterium]